MPCRLLLLLFVMTSMLGCAPSDPFPVPDQLPTESVVVEVDGHELEFPATVDFDGETWIRVKEDPADEIPGKTYIYSSDKRDDYVFYMLFKPLSLQAHGFPMEKQLVLAKLDPNSRSLILDGPTEVYLGGGLLLKSQFAKHKKTGQEELFDSEGNLQFRGYTNEGKLQGDCTYFYKDGKEMLKGKFSGGQIIEGLGFDEDGTETPLTSQNEVMQFLARRTKS